MLEWFDFAVYGYLASVIVLDEGRCCSGRFFSVPGSVSTPASFILFRNSSIEIFDLDAGLDQVGLTLCRLWVGMALGWL